MTICVKCGAESENIQQQLFYTAHILSEKTTYGTSSTTTRTSYDRFQEHYFPMCQDCVDKRAARNKKADRIFGRLWIVTSVIVFILVVIYAGGYNSLLESIGWGALIAIPLSVCWGPFIFGLPWALYRLSANKIDITLKDRALKDRIQAEPLASIKGKHKEKFQAFTPAEYKALK